MVLFFKIAMRHSLQYTREIEQVGGVEKESCYTRKVIASFPRVRLVRWRILISTPRSLIHFVLDYIARYVMCLL